MRYLKIVKLIETESRMVVAKVWVWGGEKGELLYKGYKVLDMPNE